MRSGSALSLLACVLAMVGLSSAMAPRALAQSTPASDARCDCSLTQRSAACEASVQHRDGVVAVSSSSPACSMVMWTADGLPNVSVVRDGLEIFDWFGATSPQIAVESCEICLDRTLGMGGVPADERLDVAAIRPETGIDFEPATPNPASPATSATSATAGTIATDTCPGGSPAPELLVPAQLAYPVAMERYALEGTCQVLFDIAETGAATNIRPTCSHDGFTKEAARAVAVVRFTPPYHCGAPVVRKDVVYPLVFSFNRGQRPTPSMAPIPNGAGQ